MYYNLYTYMYNVVMVHMFEQGTKLSAREPSSLMPRELTGKFPLASCKHFGKLKAGLEICHNPLTSICAVIMHVYTHEVQREDVL